ncbi:MAG: sugar ABC transporter ATP-binding protein, partial [bacterium]|nr:sugar ABC transporter ATP-binding protein [bacterium]
METKLLEMNNITREFPGVKALDDVSLDLYPGEVHGLLGENGAGKSTLIKILAGDYRKDRGEILVNGAPVDFHSPADSKNLGIRVIYQELITMDTLSVAENIYVGALPLKTTKLVDWKTLNENARQLLSTMNIDIHPKTIVGDLSVHKKQIVEIAKALNKEAAILVMDEPTAALSEEDTESLFDIIHNLKQQGVGIIYISHRMKEIFEITDRVTVLRDGKKIDTVNTRETTKDALISMMVGRTLEEFFPKKEINIGEPLLEARYLTIHEIIDDISFHVKSGEIVGLFGLLGSGRMNIVNALYGVEKLDGGQIIIQGRPVSIQSPQHALEHKLGFMPIDRKLEGLALG